MMQFRRLLWLGVFLFFGAAVTHGQTISAGSSLRYTDIDDQIMRDFEREAPTPAELAIGLACYGAIALFFLVIGILVILQYYKALNVLPEQYRQMQPMEVWLLLVPFVNIVWIFFVAVRIPKSYQAYYQSINRWDHGDCGAQIGLWYAICSICSAIPCVGFIPGFAALILMIIFLSKITTMRRDVESHFHKPPQDSAWVGSN